jgi:hypothetical protein
VVAAGVVPAPVAGVPAAPADVVAPAAGVDAPVAGFAGAGVAVAAPPQAASSVAPDESAISDMKRRRE